MLFKIYILWFTQNYIDIIWFDYIIWYNTWNALLISTDSMFDSSFFRREKEKGLRFAGSTFMFCIAVASLLFVLLYIFSLFHFFFMPMFTYAQKKFFHKKISHIETGLFERHNMLFSFYVSRPKRIRIPQLNIHYSFWRILGTSSILNFNYASYSHSTRIIDTIDIIKAVAA